MKTPNQARKPGAWNLSAEWQDLRNAQVWRSATGPGPRRENL